METHHIEKTIIIYPLESLRVLKTLEIWAYKKIIKYL